MDIKGVCYDVGRVYGGRFLTRPAFDPVTTGRELQIIRDDLHCNAVRFQGTDIGRLTTAATDALKLGAAGLALAGAVREEPGGDPGLPGRAATAAEPLRKRFPGRLVFCVGTESSLFTRGIVPGRTVDQRVANIRRAGPTIRPYAGPLQAFLAQPANGSGRCSAGRSLTPRGGGRGGRLEPVRGSSASTTTGTPRSSTATPRRSGATSGRASRCSIPSSGTVPTGATGLAIWSSARWTTCRLRCTGYRRRAARPPAAEARYARPGRGVPGPRADQDAWHPGRRGHGRRFHLDLRRPVADLQR